MFSGQSPNLSFLTRRLSLYGNTAATAPSSDRQDSNSSNRQITAKSQSFNSAISVTSSSNSIVTSETSSAMEDLIPIVNRLQDVLNCTGHEALDLPQIVVVGSQSSGKSSVLENLVQRDFLPRGKDIVTRRPLVLQLVQLTHPRDYGSPDEWAEFLHLPDQKFTDFRLVRAEIERETERVAGSQKGIARLPINLKIFSPRVLTLTLVDLPGLTKIAIGDQPPDIDVRIRKLVMEYISKPNAIILAVSPANQDIANSDALKMAREVDPSGKRTVGVLTKLDLMDAGTNAYEILVGKSLPLKLGFIGVVNRSQQNIMDDLAISSSLANEEKYFAQHPVYRSIPSHCGTQKLAKTLNSILMHHIREKLPELKSKLNLLIVQSEQELLSYGDTIFTGKAHQGSMMLRLLTKFCVNFNASIDGTFTEVSTMELSGGARLYYIFNSIFGQSLNSIDPCTGLTTQDIRTVMRNATGPRPSLFIPEIAFDLLVKPQIKRLEMPCLRCAELVFDEMLKIVNGCESRELARFPKLHQRLLEVVVEMLRERMAPTQAYIESLISIQLAYINTNHPDFIGGGAAIATLERKHDKRRREHDRTRRNVDTEHQTLMPMKPQTIHRDITPSHGINQQQGRDGGFLTYFFGNNADAPVDRNIMSSPENSLAPPPIPTEGSDRSRSPSRLAFPNEYVHTDADSTIAPAEDVEVELIRSLISSYFHITRKAIADLVPKTIMHLMVNHAKENIQNRLVSTLYREDVFADLLKEDAAVMEEREKCMALLETFRKGASLLQDIF